MLVFILGAFTNYFGPPFVFITGAFSNPTWTLPRVEMMRMSGLACAQVSGKEVPALFLFHGPRGGCIVFGNRRLMPHQGSCIHAGLPPHGTRGGATCWAMVLVLSKCDEVSTPQSIPARASENVGPVAVIDGFCATNNHAQTAS